MLLTTTGRGLYLSAFMEKVEKEYATRALMISLLLSGAIGTWISVGGSYYLISMAFSASNMFVLSRLIGGIAFTIAGGILGFIIIGAVRTLHGAIIFFLYLVGLTSYLSLLATLSNYQFPGSSFLNGRVVVICLIPMLIISPIITTWIKHHDSAIYLTVLYVFIGCLVFGVRRVASHWATWYQKIHPIDDEAVKDWYIKMRADGNPNALKSMTDPAALQLSRSMLLEAVMEEKAKRWWKPPTNDTTVLQLASSWES